MLKLSNNDLIKSASYCSVAVALIILIAKSFAWLATDSQSILASLIDSLLDISSSLINLIAIRVSMLPPDDNHRFGHEKFQDLAVFSQSIFFFASSIFIISTSSRSLWFEQTPANNDLGVQVMVFCVILTLLLVMYQTYVVSRTKSMIIAADKLHYFTDLLANIAVVGSLYLSSKYWFIDGLAGILIALYILKGSYQLFREAIRNLADEELPEEDKAKIIYIVANFPAAKGLHELKTRNAAHKIFIQFHLEMSGELSLKEAHEIADKIEEAILAEFPEAEIIIHQDPDGLEKDVNFREQIT